MRTLAGIDGTAAGLRLSTWLFGLRGPAGCRARSGILAGNLLLLLAGYSTVVLFTVGEGKTGIQVAAVVCSALGSAVCFALPWRRLPDRAVYVPAAGILLLLTLLLGAAGGVLVAYQLGFLLLLLYVGIAGPPAHLAVAAVAAELGVAAASLMGSQDTYRTVLAVSIPVYALLAAIPAFAVTWNHAVADSTAVVRRSFEDLAAARTEEEAAHLFSDLLTRVLDADDAVVLLTEHAGSHTLVRKGGYSPRHGVADMRIDLAEDPSGLVVVARSGRPLFVADAQAPAVASQRLIRELGVASAYYLPIPGEGGLMGIAVAWWNTPLGNLDPLNRSLAEMAAMPAGQVIQRVRHAERLDSPLMRDPLTDIGNRRRFDIALTDLPIGGTILLFDLDAFAALNDAYGRDTGDEILKSFAEALRRSVRQNDVVTRFGEDTFAVVLPSQTSPIASGIIIERLQRSWQPARACRFSVGVAIRTEDESPAETLARAGSDLRATKRLKVR